MRKSISAFLSFFSYRLFFIDCDLYYFILRRNKSKIKIFIIQQVDRKVDLEEIADSKGITFEELLTEIENICYSGTKLNLDYYIDDMLDESKQEQIFEYFLNSETDSLDEALQDEDMTDFSEEEIRLMRIKFLSEYAN